MCDEIIFFAFFLAFYIESPHLYRKYKTTLTKTQNLMSSINFGCHYLLGLFLLQLIINTN